MARNDYDPDQRTDSEALARWENEGGKTQRQQHPSFDSIKHSQSQFQQGFQIDRLHPQNDFVRALLSVLHTRRPMISGQVHGQG